ncbi:MAG: alpha/beta hydrolase [Eubacteriales bacterium]|nr:alpha/beta hydrolase [Eubacteriales bacterium]
MKKDFYFPSSDQVTRIHAIEWIPETEMKAVLQISHGMVEYIDRYDRFARFLNKYGIYVVGNDHLGHGESVVNEDKLGFFKHPGGNQCIIKDLNRLRTITEKKYPGIPYFMLGHSMGSFMIRQYMMVFGKGLSGVIVMGTGKQPALVLSFGKVLCKMMAKSKGWEYRSKFVDDIAFSSNNKRFEPARTSKDWLTKDQKIVDAYIADPWCSYRFTLNGFYEMFSAIQFIQKPSNIEKIPKNLPVFLVSGAEDPVGNFGKNVKEVFQSYENAHISDITMKLYDDDRHEILNETDYEKVYEDLKGWIENRI